MNNENYENNNSEEIQADASTGKVNKQIGSDVLATLIRMKNSKLLNTAAESYDPVNMAKALDDMDQEELLFFFKCVKSDLSASIFTYLSQETKERLVSAFTSDQIQNLVDEMATDDLVDFVDDLPANLIYKVLSSVEKNDAKRVKAYLNFKDDSAGTLMTPEYLQVKDHKTVKDALDLIRSKGRDVETIWEIFIVDSSRTLVGTITLDKLLESEEDIVLSSIMDTDIVSVTLNTDQELVLQAFRKYDVSVIPVTTVDHKMLGIITFDDAMDVATDESTEDMQLTNAVSPIETPFLKARVMTLVKNYGIWLAILLLLNTFTSMAISYLSVPLAPIPILLAFLPTIMGTTGNASDQSSTSAIRELALGNITTKNYFKAAWKEFRAAFITALGVAIFAFGWVLVELYSGLIQIGQSAPVIENFYGGNKDLFFVSIAGLISLTFLVCITAAKVLGISLPVLAKKIHLDPAVMSQPILSTILDIVSIVTFYLFAILLLKGI